MKNKRDVSKRKRGEARGDSENEVEEGSTDREVYRSLQEFEEVPADHPVARDELGRTIGVSVRQCKWNHQPRGLGRPPGGARPGWIAYHETLLSWCKRKDDRLAASTLTCL